MELDETSEIRAEYVKALKTVGFDRGMAISSYVAEIEIQLRQHKITLQEIEEVVSKLAKS